MIYRESQQGESRSFQYASSFATLCTDHCKWTGRGLWTLWWGPLIKKKESPDSLAVTLHISLPFFWIWHLFTQSPFTPCSEKRNGLVKYVKGTCMSSTLLWWSPMRLVILTPLVYCFAYWWTKCGGVWLPFEEHSIQWCIRFSLGFIWPLQDEILHQDFTHTLFLKPLLPFTIDLH